MVAEELECSLTRPEYPVTDNCLEQHRILMPPPFAPENVLSLESYSGARGGCSGTRPGAAACFSLGPRIFLICGPRVKHKRCQKAEKAQHKQIRTPPGNRKVKH
ncbi:hypothetical protein NDU88_000430 [Pleurodeles waltl]|uniref:Uncharacterized protein n=1 Tax=Pleurodeles waltl TaxID=8319 RepID=A0AAV7V529_PLEWA|nr:hypothetical protein NDU88_000430 [Pleurodeles waltl]